MFSSEAALDSAASSPKKNQNSKSLTATWECLKHGMSTRLRDCTITMKIQIFLYSAFQSDGWFISCSPLYFLSPKMYLSERFARKSHTYHESSKNLKLSAEMCKKKQRLLYYKKVEKARRRSRIITRNDIKTSSCVSATARDSFRTKSSAGMMQTLGDFSTERHKMKSLRQWSRRHSL